MAIIQDGYHAVDSKEVSALTKPLTVADTSLQVWLSGNTVPCQLRFETVELRDAYYTLLADALV